MNAALKPNRGTGDRQEIIDDFLLATGAEVARPADIVDYIRTRPAHPWYTRLFGSGDAFAADKHRIAQVSGLISGCRTTLTLEVHARPAPERRPLQLQVSNVLPPAPIKTRMYEVPTYLSRRADRGAGGGFIPLDPNDAFHRIEVLGQAADVLAAWNRKYRWIEAICPDVVENIENNRIAIRDEVRALEREMRGRPITPR